MQGVVPPSRLTSRAKIPLNSEEVNIFWASISFRTVQIRYGLIIQHKKVYINMLLYVKPVVYLCDAIVVNEMWIMKCI